MKSIFIFLFVLMLASGCAPGTKKRFTLIVEPPDAEITVLPGGGQPEQKYRSPADIIVQVPEDPVQAAKGKIEIKRDNYKPITIILNSIQADTMRLKLSKIQYRMKVRMIRPAVSDDLRYEDKVIALRLTPDDRHFNLSIRNLAPKPIHILWDKADYTDYLNRPHEIMPLNEKTDHRPITKQEVAAGGFLEQKFVPIDLVTYSNEKKSYTSKPLFPLESDIAPDRPACRNRQGHYP